MKAAIPLLAALGAIALATSTRKKSPAFGPALGDERLVGFERTQESPPADVARELQSHVQFSLGVPVFKTSSNGEQWAFQMVGKEFRIFKKPTPNI